MTLTPEMLLLALKIWQEKGLPALLGLIALLSKKDATVEDVVRYIADVEGMDYDELMAGRIKVITP